MKTPGDFLVAGQYRTYSVGSTIASPPPPMGPGSSFSGQPCSYPAVFTNATKQVAIIQIAEPGQPGGIRRQAYFHGLDSGVLGAIGASTFARAISVWPAPTLGDTRIAICGSTRDPQLPLSPNPINNSAVLAPPGGFPPDSGFVAVYDGDLNLQWSYHFFADDQNATTTITDVSIRVEPCPTTGQLREYVTYCGATRNGNPPVPNTTSTMLPADGIVAGPFVAPASAGGDTYAGGDDDNGQYLQWDGIVGRVSRVCGTAAPQLDFHSIVGGGGDDALLGLAQKSLDEFVVVGLTQSAGSTGLAFPLTTPNAFGGGTVIFNQLPGWTLGVALRFIVPAPATPTQPLVLADSRVIGSTSSTTIARDVVWQDAPGTGLDWIYVVGSTDFGQLAAEFPQQSVGAFNTVASGFLVATPSVALGTGWFAGRYIDAPGAPAGASTGAVGVAGWNEYQDHVVVSGWVEYPGGTTRELVTSCFREPIFGSPTWPGMTAVHRFVPDGPPAGNLRSDFPGPNDGLFQAFGSSTPFSLQAPGRMTSGGVSVYPNGRVAVVGYTALPPIGPVTEFPVVGPTAEIRTSAGIPPSSTQVDALRLQLDMLPYGVCRIAGDGTECGPSTGTAGTTTPACALSQFGNALAPATLERIYLDVDGVPAPNVAIDILVDRPVTNAVALGALWLGLPVLSPSPFPGIEVWGDLGTALTFGTVPFDESWRLSLGTLPPGSATFTIQFLSLLLPLDYCADAAGCASDPLCQSNAVFQSAASPALLFRY